MKYIKTGLIIFNIFVFIILFNITINKHEYYLNLYERENNKTFYSSSTLRGRIIDSKGNILVDNKGVKALYYINLNNNSLSEELSIASSLSKILDIKTNNKDDDYLKEYYYLCNKDKINNLVDDDIYQKYNERKITKEELLNIKYSKISDNDLKNINKKAAYIYHLMKNGYSYQEKLIKSNLTDEELNKINDLNIDSLNVHLNYIRVYNYDTCLNELFGSIGFIPKEEVKEYLNNGYELNSIVGTSFLEKYYEDDLKGKPDQYQIINNKIVKIKDGKRGNDIILGIDIESQIELENIVKEEIINAKKYFTSKYYKGSYIVISEPKTGLIKNMIAYKYEDGKFISDVIGLLTNSYTVGSAVKGASQSVAYKYNAIDEKTKINDSCVKLYSQKEKCSWKRLGMIDDISSITYSSNYFQFINAIKVSGYSYKRNMKFNPNITDFNKYRETFKEYGLGSKTGIDLFEEQVGITGSNISGDLLLNLSIGQYDTYTPLMLNQYISTIANNGKRMKLSLVKCIVKNGIKEDLKGVLLNKVEIDDKYIKRVQKALNTVSLRGTGAGYVKKYTSASKTGTSETYYNGKPTYTKTFVSYFPYDSPEYAYLIISPNISYKNNKSSYIYPLNSRITKKITEYLYNQNNL